MSIYNKYLFINPPGGCEPTETSDPIPFSHTPSVEDFADICEMYMRRRMITYFFSSLSSDDIATELSLNRRATPSNFLNFNATKASWTRLGHGDRAAGKFDANDTDNADYDPTNAAWRLFHFYASDTITWERLFYGMVQGLFNNNDFIFADPTWSPPEQWETYAFDTASITVDHDGTVIDSGSSSSSESSSSTRYSVLGPFFKFISDAQYARPLKPVQYVNDDGEIISFNMPPYAPWYDPSSERNYRSVGGKKIGLLGRFQGSTSNGDGLHALPAFRFYYSDSYAKDLSDEDVFSPYYGGFNYVGYLRNVPDNCIAGSNYLIPKLGTDTSWWEEAKLSEEAIDNICGQRLLDDLDAFYVPPNITPTLFFDCSHLPPESGWTPKEGELGSNFFPKFPFAQSIQHAQSFLSKLCKIVVPIGSFRTYFDASSYIRDTLDDGSSSDSSAYIAVYDITAKGWRDGSTSEKTSIDDDYPDGLSFHGMGLGTAYSSSNGRAEHRKTTITIQTDGSRATTIQREVEDHRCSYTLEKLIPITADMRLYNARNFSWTSGEDSGTESNNDDIAIQSLIPPWTTKFIKDASLFLAYEASRSEENSYDGTYTYSSTTGEWTGNATKKKGVKLHKGVVKLPAEWDPSICGFTFDNFDLWNFMESVMPADGLPGSKFIAEIGDYIDTTTYTGYNEYTEEEKYDYKRNISRSISNQSLFMVIELDPDADLSWEEILGTSSTTADGGN